ncbi:hypothetical protein ERIC2_c04030 [Paenibacillus larvae subsp. larvae DSM 25430]|uniref:Uncharacterized protein n=1 Tax=Paenibacillus larvae subsp. larvae DSM 25430 TaxID=697284 RepID=V9W3S6_9BACL|nr:hypothetical protein ERIC2_c04030 [Paenibacillus larvae subsp. larvae DSM 25430]
MWVRIYNFIQKKRYIQTVYIVMVLEALLMEPRFKFIKQEEVFRDGKAGDV